ncbi:MAG: glycoside hydrolase family 57 protein, partial [Bacillota bacterium]
MPAGYLALVLHAHLPYVRHQEEDTFLEEIWFFEALTETYIPLVRVFDSLINDGVDFRITVSLSPPLVCMMADPMLQQRYLRHLDKLIILAEKEMARTKGDAAFHAVAEMYLNRFREARHIFAEQYGMNLVRAFKKFHDLGRVEVITCSGTHGYLPLMLRKESMRAQVRAAVDLHQRHFGVAPRGIWLPECGYTPGVDEILKEAGIQFFFTDTHGIMFATPKPRYGVYAPLYTPAGVAAFGRDQETGRQVWDMHIGYPGDYNYREFYRDIGFDLEMDYIAPYIFDGRIRIDTGIKYYRITGKTDRKEPYQPEVALGRAADHAGNFMFNREKQVHYLAGQMDRPPIITAPYDAELFGHWWYEGPQWLDFLIRKIYFDQNTLELTTPWEYLNKYPINQVAGLPMSSWGHKGFSEVWLDPSN